MACTPGGGFGSGSDSEGVGNAKVWGGTVPYPKIDVLSVSGRTARRLPAIRSADLADCDIEWAREQPVTLAGISGSELCPLAWTADRPAVMDGWSEPERDDNGPVRWTVSRAAHLSLPARCSGRVRLRVVAAYAVSNRNIDSLQLSLNGRPIQYRRDVRGRKHRSMRRNSIAQAFATSPLPKLEIAVDQLDQPPGGSREARDRDPPRRDRSD